MKLIGCVSKGSAAATSPCTAVLSLPRPTWSLSSHDRCNVPLAALRAPDDWLQPTIRRHAVLPLHALAESQSVETVDASGNAPAKPTAAETARTVLDIAAHGTLATTNADGKPLGTYASYVLDGQGQPILRLRSGAVHTANLLRNPYCSLFVQASDKPARLLARVTLMGDTEEVSGEEARFIAEEHRTLHGEGAGIDNPQTSDLYYRLRISECFYVGGLGGNAIAEVVPAEVLREAEPDRLRDCAPALVSQWNSERLEDVFRIAADTEGVSFEELQNAQLLWVDRLGLYLFIQRVGEPGEVRRRSFVREVSDERDVRSTLTMLAQVSWEKERNYQPVMPVLAITSSDEIAV